VSSPSTAIRTRRRLAVGYGLPFVALAVALALRWLLDPLLGDTLPLVTLFAAVAAAVWLGGLTAAVAVTLIGYVVVAYLFIEPRGSLGFDMPSNVAGFVAYLLTCALIIASGQALRRARARDSAAREVARVTLRSIGDAVIATDLAAKVIYLNPVAAALTGWSEAEATGKPLDAVFRIVNETTRLPVANPAERALREGVVVGLANHTVLLRRDGTECPIDDSAAPITDERGAVSGCVLVFRDVTAQRNVERDKETQLLTARRLAAIVETSEVAIIGKRLDGTIETWNEAAERLFGYTAAEALGRHISLIIPRDRLEEEERIIATLREGRRVEHFDTERVRSDGRRVTISLSVAPIKDAHGNVVGASKIARDVTRQREAEEDLRKLATELSEADRRKDEFLATLAHELRGPLAPLSNVLALWKHSNDAAELERARGTMERQLGQLVRLVDDLLDVNRITRNRLELRKTRVELATVVASAVEACRPIIEDRNQTLTVTLPDGSCELYADPARLAQVFANLLNNSSKYTDPGGRVDLSARRDGDGVTVTVRDTGIGIPPAKLAGVFEIFSQVESALDRSQGGLGIGLAIVKRLVHLHDGSVEARSAGLGHGSEFVVRLPLPIPAAAQAAAAPRAKPAAMASRKILVVDDNVDSAESLAALLQLAGHETVAVFDGVGAIEAAEKHRPDVVLLDIGLPRMSGYEVCRRLRDLPWGDEVVVMAVTGWGQGDDPGKWQQAGFDAHLVKPAQYDDLMTLLSASSPRAKLSRQERR
jgi:PAS domain S-box-containing protein